MHLKRNVYALVAVSLADRIVSQHTATHVLVVFLNAQGGGGSWSSALRPQLSFPGVRHRHTSAVCQLVVAGQGTVQGPLLAPCSQC